MHAVEGFAVTIVVLSTFNLDFQGDVPRNKKYSLAVRATNIEHHIETSRKRESDWVCLSSNKQNLQHLKVTMNDSAPNSIQSERILSLLVSEHSVIFLVTLTAMHVLS